MTLIELVEASAAQLADAGVAFGHGTANAFDEAAWLVLWQMGLPLDDLDGVAEMAVSPQQQDTVAELISQRIHITTGRMSLEKRRSNTGKTLASS